MKAEITFSQLWYNPSVLGFFFRTQSERTLQNLHDNFQGSWDDALYLIEDHAEIYGLDLDDIEEMFYEESIKSLANEFGLELNNTEEDEEDE